MIRFCFRRHWKYWKMAERNSQNIDRKSTQITVIDKCIICSVDVSLCRLGARTRQNLQSTLLSAAHCERLICFCLSNGAVSQYLGQKGTAFVCGSCTCRLNRFDTIRQKYEAVKEDIEVQGREILLWQSQPQAQAQLQPCPQRASCDSVSQSDSSMERLAVWTQIWRCMIGWENSRALGIDQWPGAVPQSLIFSTAKGV